MESPLEFKKLTDKFRGFDKLNLAVALVDISFKVIHHNNGFLRQFQSTEETGSMARLDQIFSNFDQKLDALKQAGLLSGHLLNFVIPGVKQRNIERYYDLQVSRLDPEVDLFEGFSISFIDVSDRERELVKLRETSEHHEKFIKYTTSGVMIHRDGKIVYVNDQGLKMIRATSAEDLIGRNVMDFVSEGFKTIAMERIRQMTETNKPVEPIEEIFIREDKTTFTGEIFAYPVHFQGLPAIKVIINDVSGRKEAEDRLRKSEKKYATLVNHVQDVIFQTDKDAKITFLSDAWFDLTGFEVQDAIGKSILDFLEETDSKSTELYTRIRRLLMLGIATHERDLKIKTAEEGSKYIQVKFSAIYNDEHSIVGISGMIIDIHARKSAELELQKLENSLRKQQRIYLKLAKSQVLNGDDFNAAIRLIAQTSAGVMHLDRVNIWRMNKEDGSLVCLCNFDETTKSFSGEGETIYNFHNYLKMVQEERVLNADDALTDPRMSEFLDSYIIPSGIKSMMDAGIFIGDDMWGFICFDMVESKRHWSVEDRTFASNLADMISIAWVKSEKKATTEALNKSEQLNSTLLNNAGDAILLISPEGIIEQVNKMACVLSGYQREELIGAFMNGFIP